MCKEINTEQSSENIYREKKKSCSWNEVKEMAMNKEKRNAV
ncbi:MAG: hypothetical protein WKG06_02400 [Segetibacter sp.]